ncbi:MAG: hypothetical protein ORN54_01475 [Cyclobacteriaceae bacterium]|nr:hypothetical protein [Cyclobacteriaceae bacterium]
MKSKIQLSVFIVSMNVLFSCKPEVEKPDLWFSKVEQLKIINSCVHYSTKLPPDATNETKFSDAFDWYYDKATEEYDWRACKQINENEYYFLMTRKARSIWPARDAIGGKMKLDAKKNLIEYEELFRTWKMAEDSLNIRSFELFNLMTFSKDLTPFRSKYKGDRYIEFPDDRWYFNKDEKRWRDRFLDSSKLN